MATDYLVSFDLPRTSPMETSRNYRAERYQELYTTSQMLAQALKEQRISRDEWERLMDRSPRSYGKMAPFVAGALKKVG